MRRLFLRSSKLDDFCERLRMVDGEIGENLSIDAHLFLVKPSNQARIRNLVQARGCIDSGDPESAEFTLFGFSVAIGVLSRFVNVMFGDTMDFASGTPVSFGRCQEFLPAQMGCDLVL